MEKVINKKKRVHDCPFCDKEHEIEEITRIVSTAVKNEMVEHEEAVLKCLTADEEWYHGKMLDYSLLNARNAYRVKHGLLTSYGIKAIREKYRLTQKELSNLLGLGDITISRYETSHIQEEIIDAALRDIEKNPYIASMKLEKHKSLFSVERFEKLRFVFKGFVKEESLPELKRQELQQRYIDYDAECAANGYKLLDIEKVADVISYFAEHVKYLYKVKLMKLLWYTDALFFRQYGCSMTGLVYQHKPLGALPIGHSAIIGLPTVTIQEEETENGTSYRVLPLDPSPTHTFSLEEQEVLSKVAIRFKDLSGNEIAKHMHEEDAYKNTMDDEIICFSQEHTISFF